MWPAITNDPDKTLLIFGSVRTQCIGHLGTGCFRQPAEQLPESNLQGYRVTRMSRDSICSRLSRSASKFSRSLCAKRLRTPNFDLEDIFQAFKPAIVNLITA
jgi:hypothetical protein